MRKKTLLFLAALVVSLGGIAYLLFSDTAVFEKKLDLTYSNNDIIPVFARTEAGIPFTGVVYATFSGERFLDCTEWEGRFENGKPEGRFTIYKTCGVEHSKPLYKNGTLAKDV